MKPLALYNCAKGDHVKIVYSEQCTVNSRQKTGYIIDCFPAGEVPERDLVIKYYGSCVVANPRYNGVFKATKTDRIVIKFETAGRFVFTASCYGIYPISRLTQENIKLYLL